MRPTTPTHTHTQRHTLYLSLSPSRTHTQLLNNRFFFVTFQLISSFFVDFWVDFYFSTNPPTHSQRVSVADSSQHGTPSDFVTPSAHLHTPRPLYQLPSSTILFHFFFFVFLSFLNVASVVIVAWQKIQITFVCCLQLQNVVYIYIYIVYTISSRLSICVCLFLRYTQKYVKKKRFALFCAPFSPCFIQRSCPQWPPVCPT